MKYISCLPLRQKKFHSLSLMSKRIADNFVRYYLNTSIFNNRINFHFSQVAIKIFIYLPFCSPKTFYSSKMVPSFICHKPKFVRIYFQLEWNNIMEIAPYIFRLLKVSFYLNFNKISFFLIKILFWFCFISLSKILKSIKNCAKYCTVK